MDNPFLKSKKTRKYGTPFKGQTDSLASRKTATPSATKNTPAKQTPRDETLMTLNSTEKNPIIYPATLKNFVHKRKILLSPAELSRLSTKHRNVASFDDRLNGRPKSKSEGGYDGAGRPRRGILRWDDHSFMNKESISTAELKNIKKKLKDKKLVKSIQSYRSEKKKLAGSECSIDKEATSTGSSDTSGTNRRDVFGNQIIRGGSKHRVCFSFHGDMKVVENWKALNKKNSIKPDKSLALEEDGDEKKKCSIF